MKILKRALILGLWLCLYELLLLENVELVGHVLEWHGSIVVEHVALGGHVGLYWLLIPRNSVFGDTRFLGLDVPVDLIDEHFWGVILNQILVGVIVVHIIPALGMIRCVLP